MITDIFSDLNRNLYKDLSPGVKPSEVVMSAKEIASYNEIISESLVSGEIHGDISLIGGLIESKNFVSGSAGWRLTPTSGEINFSLSIASLNIPDTTTANSFHVNSDGDAWWGANVADFDSNNDNANAYVLKTGVAKFQSVTLSGSVLLNDIVTGSEISIQGWTHDMVFSVTDADTIAWTSGTITLMNGDTYAIVSGNTGNMAAETYMYLDIATSTTVLQTTTTKTTAVGSGKIMVAIAVNAVGEAEFVVFGSTEQNIDGGKLRMESITANEIAANTITANEIEANTITASEITAGTITGTEISASAIIKAGTGNNVGVLDGNDATYRIYAGNATPANAPFSVTQAGIVHAEDITLGNRFVTVAPGESVQDAIDVVTSTGGIVVLRNGTHTQSNHIIIPSNVYLQGQNAEATIIDFNSTANQIQIIGSNAYTTGTLSISNGSTTVTGVSTVWISAMIGRRILLGGLWYVIIARASNTSITIAAPFGGETLASGTSYTLATVVVDVKISDLTIKGSYLSAIHGQYCQEFFLSDLNIQTSAIGVEIDTSSNIQITDLDLVANNAGIDLNDVHFMVMGASGTLDDLVGNGLTLNGVSGAYFNGCFFLNSAGDGINITDCTNLIFSGVGVFTSTGQGWEFVSGNNDIALLGCGARGCDGDGIKMTASTDGVKISSCVLKDNGGYGVNIAVSSNDGTVIGSSTFSGNSSGAINDVGTGTIVRGNFGVSDNVSSFVKSYEAGEAISSKDAVFIEPNIGAKFLSSHYLTITHANQTGLNITGDLTVECWFLADSFGGNRNLIDKGNGGGEYTIAHDGTNFIARRRDGSNDDIDLTYAFTTTGEWHHIAFVIDGSAATLYFDGVSVDTDTIVGTTPASQDFSIGSRSAGGNFWTGQIDDVRVWNIARSSSEILANYKLNLAGTEANLQGYWDFANSSILDLTSNDNDLTNTTSVTFVTTTDNPLPVRVFRTDASTASTVDAFIGFADAAVSFGSDGNIVISGVVTGMSGLLTGARYYLSDTTGALAISAGSNERKVGIAVSDTELLITNIW